MSPELEKYWEGIKDSDEEALEKLYKSTFSLLVNYSRTITFDYNLAEEAVQDVFLKIWQNRSSLIVHESIRAYLFRSVHNHSLNLLRQQKTLKQSVNRPASEDLWRFIAEHYELNEFVIENLFAADTNEMIQEVLGSLPEQCCKVFSMSRFDGFTNEEIANRLSIAQNTVKAHIYKALQKISEALRK
ncbi:MAG: RNA polymerase sigma-70 factor [Prolixibacteraceae bacterium]|nr:RNA polymerase sigma-70 factor [Prolixibacteraceae bacterium]